ncbi:MAG: hypothetical protein KIS61_37190, partial [Candidatus Eremiobacteraeota bacterium]|nr:hypothetical protein [Candidatus Eremiobacteraeota bacterium]
MRKTLALSCAALALVAGCSSSPTTSSERAVTTESSERQVPSVTHQKGTTVSVETNGNKRTDGTYQSSHSDADGARAS